MLKENDRNEQETAAQDKKDAPKTEENENKASGGVPQKHNKWSIYVMLDKLEKFVNLEKLQIEQSDADQTEDGAESYTAETSDVNKTERRRKFIISVVYYAIIAALAYLTMRYIIRWVMPFLISFAIALAFKPLINFLHRKIGMNKRLSGVLLVVVSYVVIGVLLWLGGYRIFVWLRNILTDMPEYYSAVIYPIFENTNNWVLDLVNRLAPQFTGEISDMLGAAANSLRDYIVSLSADALTALAGTSRRIPLYLLSFIFTILGSLFVTMDYVSITNFIKRQMGEKTLNIVMGIKSYLGKTIASYAKAYLILMLITFIEISVGMLALKVDNPFGIAAIIAIADALPVLGTGTILLPWAVISLIQQQYFFAGGLVLLYLIVTVVRQFIEPKIVGDQLGLPPIVTLISIYLGFVWFGLDGAIIFPISMNIIVSLHKAGKIHIWK
ncbi:MAG TPA: sporulation integral membrane protein YtvI [Firmicutes bacterium]|nr:sporulation integral membrane protein YtvI [Bacillota bacterium]